MEIEDIIAKHLSKINRKWFNRKKEEFKSSPFYDKSRNIIYHCEVLDELLVEDEDGNERSIDQFIKIEIKFEDFCLSSKDYYNKFHAFFEEKFWDFFPEDEIVIASDLSALADRLIIDVYSASSEIPSNNIITYIENIKTSVELFLGEKSDEIDPYILLYFKDDLFEKLDAKFENKIFATNFGEIDEKLDFTLELERFSALLYLIGESGFASKEDLLKFTCKQFRCVDKKGNLTVPILTDLRDRYNKQGNKTHQITGMQEILEKMDNVFSIAFERKEP